MSELSDKTDRTAGGELRCKKCHRKIVFGATVFDNYMQTYCSNHCRRTHWMSSAYVKRESKP